MKKLKTILAVVIIMMGTSCVSYKYCPTYVDNAPQEEVKAETNQDIRG